MLELLSSREINQRPQGETGAAAFTPSYHREMLMDERRVRAFQKAIEYYASPQLDFMEFGIGTGVMSVYAARHFRHVYAVERDPYIYEIAKQNFDHVGLLDKNVTLIQGDVLESDLPKVDVIMAELLSTLMIHEPEVPALNRARDHFLHRNGVLIPSRVVNTVTPAWSKYKRQDILFRSPYTLFTGIASPEIIGESKAFYTADFIAGRVPMEIKTSIETTCLFDSEINSLILGTHVQLAPNITFNGSDSLNPPMVVPINPVIVKAGQQIRINISYHHFSDWDKFNAEITCL